MSDDPTKHVLSPVARAMSLGGNGVRIELDTGNESDPTLAALINPEQVAGFVQWLGQMGLLDDAVLIAPADIGCFGRAMSQVCGPARHGPVPGGTLRGRIAAATGRSHMAVLRWTQGEALPDNRDVLTIAELVAWTPQHAMHLLATDLAARTIRAVMSNRRRGGSVVNRGKRESVTARMARGNVT